MSSNPSNQKLRERSQLERFKNSFALFPIGEIEDSEKPDFLVHTDGRILGIELTDLYRTAQLGEQPMQEVESLQKRVVQQAQSLYEANGGPLLYVSVAFEINSRLTKARVRVVAQELAAFISSLNIVEGDHFSLENPYDNQGNYPEDIGMLFVDRFPGYTRSLWHPLAAAMVPNCSPEELQQVMDRKNKRYSLYRGKCQKIWLIIVADGFGLSSTMDIPDKTRHHSYNSDFDRIFYFENFDLRWFELARE